MGILARRPAYIIPIADTCQISRGQITPGKSHPQVTLVTKIEVEIPDDVPATIAATELAMVIFHSLINTHAQIIKYPRMM
jgi:hypothetical protein